MPVAIIPRTWINLLSHAHIALSVYWYHLTQISRNGFNKRPARVALQIEGCICFDKTPPTPLDKHRQVLLKLESLWRIVESVDRRSCLMIFDWEVEWNHSMDELNWWKIIKKNNLNLFVLLSYSNYFSTISLAPPKSNMCFFYYILLQRFHIAYFFNSVVKRHSKSHQRTFM